MATSEAPPIEIFHGDRGVLAPLFALADDSRAAIARYRDAGVVLVARDDAALIGLVLLAPTEDASVAEIVSLAVVERWQRRGVGARLVEAALVCARDAGARVVRLATATADIGNLRFYQRLGFRMTRVEQDAYTPASGYPADASIDGIPLRDRVWFERSLSR